jgi:outer membrane protein assembly factor BamB
VFSSGRHQLISLGAQWLVSYNPDDGSQWWRAKVGTGFAAVPTPVFDRDRVFVCTGFNSPELVAVKTSGSGELTESDILWRYTRKVSEISTPIIVDSEIYFASSKGFVTCLDTETGSMHWQERVGGNFAASPTYADGRIYFTNTEGITTVIQSGRQFQPIATNQLFGETYASLSVYQEWFLLRTNPYLFALRRDD